MLDPTGPHRSISCLDETIAHKPKAGHYPLHLKTHQWLRMGHSEQRHDAVTVRHLITFRIFWLSLQLTSGFALFFHNKGFVLPCGRMNKYWSVQSSLKCKKKRSVFGVKFPYFRLSHFLIPNRSSGKQKIWLAIFWVTLLRTCRDRRREGGSSVSAWSSLCEDHCFLLFLCCTTDYSAFQFVFQWEIILLT